MVCTLLAGVNVVAFAADDNDLIVSVHSFYNDADKGGDGEHLFTKDADEMSWLSSLPTWNDEGESWKAPVSSSLAVYRVYNPNSGEHHYAAADEASWLVSQGWTQEKIAFYSDDNMGVPVYRLWNGLDGVGSHYYTTDEGEASWLASIGWQAEGVNFYGVKEEQKSMTAAQTGANEITVTSVVGEFTGLETFTVSHGDVADELADLEYDEELDAYVITLANPIVDAVYTVSCSDTDFAPATFQGEESEKVMTAVQTGSKEITVVSKAEFTGIEEFTVMKGAVEQSVASVEFDDDMCTVTLTMDGNITEAEYTVICSDLEYEPASFTGEVGELSAIFIDDELIDISAIAPTGNYTYAVGYKTVDQWGNDFAISSFDSAVCSAGPVIDTSDNMVVVTSASVLVAGTNHTVSLVSGTVVGTQTVTVSAASMAADIEVGEITATAAEAKTNTTGRIDVDDVSVGDRYYFPVHIEDQYGNVLNKTALNALVANGYLLVSPDADATTAVLQSQGTKAVGDVFDELDDGTTIMYVKGDGKSYGQGIVNIVSVTGASDTATAEIAQSERIEDIAFVTESATLQVGKKVGAVVIATNNYGEMVDMYNEVAIVDSNGTAINAETPVAEMYFKYVPENGRGSDVKSYFTLSGGNAVAAYVDDASTETRVFALVGTAKGVTILTTYAAGGTKVTPKNYTITDAATVAGIKGLAEGVNTTFANTASSITLKLNDIVFIDSDGDVIDTAYNAAYVDAGVSTGATVTANSMSAVVTTTNGPASFVSKSGSEIKLDPQDCTLGSTYKVKVTLYKGNGAGKTPTEVASKTFEYKVFNANDDNITYSAKIKDGTLGKLDKTTLYAGDPTSVTDSAIIVMYQTDSNGATLPVDVQGVEVRGAELVANELPAVVSPTSATGALITAPVEQDEAGTTTIRLWTNGKYIDVDLNYDVNTPQAIAALVVDSKFNMTSKTSFTKVNNITKDALGVPGVVSVTDTTGATYYIAVINQYGSVVKTPTWTYNGKALTTGAPATKGTLTVAEDSLVKDFAISI